MSGCKHLISENRSRAAPSKAVFSMFDSGSHLTTDQLNSTSLKWGNDGELSELDLQRILGLLSQVDPVAEALMEGRSEAA